MTTTARQLRGRNLAAAKRSLKLITDAAAQHDQILSQGGVPEQDFTASVIKYTRALDVIRALDALDGIPVEPDGLVEVSRDDLAPFLKLVLGMIPEGQQDTPLADSPLTRLLEAVTGPEGESS